MINELMQKKEIEKFYLKRINELIKYDKAYHNDDNPLISDKYYDAIKNEVINLEKKYKYLNNKNSPSKKVGFKPSDKFKKVPHEVPMLSLANAFSTEQHEELGERLAVDIKKAEARIGEAKDAVVGEVRNIAESIAADIVDRLVNITPNEGTVVQAVDDAMKEKG